ncbi:hypothetical protein Dsin_014010 [Dipteronia sinensis]|uniref:Uncharacterized protein n=1 Tax=Dipteronia sinensis TaxID=43782 RepID=A0AAE0ALS2_9ROSI|nr:hypothetical protein Dsin_014010 [Dipteronia sinensis]
MIQVKDLREGNINALCEKAHQLMAAGSESRDTLPISVCNFKKLRTLLTDGNLYGSSKVVRKIFDELTCLKVLGMSGSRVYSIKHIPKKIGKLIHLRYLD